MADPAQSTLQGEPGELEHRRVGIGEIHEPGTPWGRTAQPAPLPDPLDVSVQTPPMLQRTAAAPVAASPGCPYPAGAEEGAGSRGAAPRGASSRRRARCCRAGAEPGALSRSLAHPSAARPLPSQCPGRSGGRQAPAPPDSAKLRRHRLRVRTGCGAAGTSSSPAVTPAGPPAPDRHPGAAAGLEGKDWAPAGQHAAPPAPRRRGPRSRKAAANSCFLSGAAAGSLGPARPRGPVPHRPAAIRDPRLAGSRARPSALHGPGPGAHNSRSRRSGDANEAWGRGRKVGGVILE